VSTWWESYRSVYFALSTLSTAMPWDLPKGKRRIYSSGKYSFDEREISGQYGEIEEALWAIRRGL
jgi:hypothetical protein